MKKIFVNNSFNVSVTKVFAKSYIITEDLIGLRFKVYNGRDFVLVPIQKDMVGFRLGEFVWTRARYEFKKKKKKK